MNCNLRSVVNLEKSIAYAWYNTESQSSFHSRSKNVSMATESRCARLDKSDILERRSECINQIHADKFLGKCSEAMTHAHLEMFMRQANSQYYSNA